VNLRPSLSRARLLNGALAACAAASLPRRSLGAPMPAATVTLGDEVFLRESWRELRGRCVGIVTNQTGVTAQLDSVVDAMRRNKQICVKAIYSPEHGLRGDQAAGAYVTSYVDERTGLPVHSLYGATRRPSEAMLEGADVLLFDIQDVGARAYTYVSTMAYVMQAAKQYGKSVWILDRPNPTGGEIVEGPVLEPKFASFIGLYPIAMRHGMTVGELARMFNDRFEIGCDLRVVAMRNYRRAMFWPDTGLAWVQSSPNIPNWETTLLYPGTGLIDEAGLNNGTNFTKPFAYAGAYKLDGRRLADDLNGRDIPGVHFRPASWTPIAGFWAGKTLGGVELVVTDRRAFRAVRSAVEILVAVRKLAPGTLTVHAASLDRDWGTDSLRLGLTSGLGADEIVGGWESSVREFENSRTRYLLYD
jgi:uncharacterized protein YbbC (DUF1343 family)